MVEGTTQTFGGIDILVNTAGTEPLPLAIDVTEAHWDRVLNVNRKGHFSVARQ